MNFRQISFCHHTNRRREMDRLTSGGRGRLIAAIALTFYRDGEISHCGINSIELLRDADGWKVTQISDTRKREGCPDPLG